MLDQRKRARGRAPVVRAGFERYVDGRAFNGFAARFDVAHCHDFGMGASRLLRETRAE